VSEREHEAWFRRILHDPSSRVWIGIRQGNPIGQVRIDVSAAVGRVSISVDLDVRGRGFGRVLLELMVKIMRSEFQVSELLAEVHFANAASLRIFEGVGFRQEGRSGEMAILRLKVHEPFT
jgi:RimJ/RimL family protein N-acetyltransferase